MLGGAKGIGLGIDLGLVNQYRRTGGKSYIDPEVLASLKAVCICYGKSNDDPDRAVVKNLVDPDNPFVISNAAYKLNSGYGKYEVDFLDWFISAEYVPFYKVASTGFSASTENVSFYIKQLKSANIASFKVKAKVSGSVLYKYYFNDGNDIYSVYYELKDGINILPKSEGGTVDYYEAEFIVEANSSVELEQIPSFEGAFVTDGVDDLITSTKSVQDMLEGSNECTVLSMIWNLTNDKVTYNNQIRPYTDGYIRNQFWTSSSNKLSISGYTINNIDYNGYISRDNVDNVTDILGDKKDYTKDIGNGKLDGKFSVEGYVLNNGQAAERSQVAWYWTIIANKVLTTDQINQIIAYYNLDKCVTPDILYDVKKQGITNENHAEFGDKLIDYSGNGKDLQLYNIAWNGGSGIGKYEVDFAKWAKSANYIEGNSFYFKVKGSGFAMYTSSAAAIPSFKVNVIGGKIDYRYIDSSLTFKTVVLEEGINIIPESFKEEGGRTIGFGNPIGGNEITITQIPSYENALVLDGVTDYGKVTGIPIYKDYTFIIDRQIISIDGAGIIASKSETPERGAYLFEYLGKPNYISTWSFYNDNGQVATTDFTRGISYQSKYSYNGKELTAGTTTDSDKLWLGVVRDNDNRFSNAAFYSVMSFSYSMSEFLIERQLKKHKLGTLYPDMVEFRPIVTSNREYESIIYYNSMGEQLYPGDHLPVNSKVYISVNTIGVYKTTSVKVNGVETMIEATMGGEYNIFMISKSPQRINITIEQDENYVQWNPVVESNVEYSTIGYLNYSHNLATIKVGDYISIGDIVAIRVILGNAVDEVVNCKVNGQECEIVNVSPKVFDCKFTITSKSPQNINITIDEYIRYEDIVQPYPFMIDIYDSETDHLYTWGDKLKVGSKVIFKDWANNLLPEFYHGRFDIYQPNGIEIIELNKEYEVFKGFGFKTYNVWKLDDNEPKCILSPSRLRIPNSSYKLLGYIPDISGHGNHGKLNNFVFNEESGANEDGSIRFDGVDDFVTIPTLSKGGKQVLMKVNWWGDISSSILYDQRGTGSAFAIYNEGIAYSARNDGNTYIDGILNNYITSNELQGITHNITGTNKAVIANGLIKIGCSNQKAYFSKMSLYDFMLFDEISTEDKIKELNEYVGIEAKVEQPPYYWDAYDKTNSDEDRATIQQRGIAVGDYDLTNNNFAYDKMSGFGGYEFAKFDNTEEWQLYANNTSIDVVSRNGYSITLKRLTNTSFWSFQNAKTTERLSKNIPFKIRANKAITVCWDFFGDKADGSYVSVAVTWTTLTPNEDTLINLGYLTEEQIAENEIVSNTSYRLWFYLPTLAVNEEVTIEMLPLYPNGLLYDGVTDYSENANIPAFTDFTAIAKRTDLRPSVTGASFIQKGLSAGWNTGGAFSEGRYEGSAYYCSSFGKTNSITSVYNKEYFYQTPTNYNGITINIGDRVDSNGLRIGSTVNSDGSTGSFWKGVLYKLILYPKTIDLLQINFLKNMMEKDEIIDINSKIFKPNGGG